MKSEFKLKRNLSGDGYSYLSQADSELYDSVKDSDDEKDKTIKKLILDKAHSSYAAHCACKY